MRNVRVSLRGVSVVVLSSFTRGVVRAARVPHVDVEVLLCGTFASASLCDPVLHEDVVREATVPRAAVEVLLSDIFLSICE